MHAQISELESFMKVCGPKMKNLKTTTTNPCYIWRCKNSWSALSTTSAILFLWPRLLLYCEIFLLKQVAGERGNIKFKFILVFWNDKILSTNLSIKKELLLTFLQTENFPDRGNGFPPLSMAFIMIFLDYLYPRAIWIGIRDSGFQEQLQGQAKYKI